MSNNHHRVSRKNQNRLLSMNCLAKLEMLLILILLLKHLLCVTSTGCNYAKGRWVADSQRPLYSGFGCKQWLSDMWACRLTQRADFTYEGYRWQPDNCEMRDFEGSKFLRRYMFFVPILVLPFLGRKNCCVCPKHIVQVTNWFPSSKRSKLVVKISLFLQK